MSTKALMSAARAAGFAMAAEDAAEPLAPIIEPAIEDLAEPLVPVIRAKPVPAALPARIPHALPSPIPLEILRMQRAVRRFWIRLWLAGAWGGRAAA